MPSGQLYSERRDAESYSHPPGANKNPGMAYIFLVLTYNNNNHNNHKVDQHTQSVLSSLQ